MPESLLPEPEFSRRQVAFAREHMRRVRGILHAEAEKAGPLSDVRVAYSEACEAINRLDLVKI